ncbi:MAG: MMPL family transporter [Candidatus Alcyoniella australis]|nr:MMPL family transporter [Candidatus Alcyoniella australis]
MEELFSGLPPTIALGLRAFVLALGATLFILAVLNLLKRFRDVIAVFLYRFRVPVLLAMCAATIFFGYFLKDWNYASNLKDDLPDNNPVKLEFEQFMEEFGSAELLTVVVEAPDVFTPDVLRLVRRLTQECEGLPEVDEVISLANVSSYIQTRDADGESLIKVRHFLDGAIPEDREGLQALKQRALDQEMWVGDILSADSTITTVNVKLSMVQEDMEKRLELVELVYDAMITSLIPEPRQTSGALFGADFGAKYPVSPYRETQIAITADPIPRENVEDRARPASIRLYTTGISVLSVDSLWAMEHDTNTYLIWTPVILILLLFLFTRTARGIVIPLLIIITSVCTTLGLFFMRGHSYNMITTVLPTFLMVYCLSDTIHILMRYHEEYGRLGERKAAVIQTLRVMMIPCFLTSTTTAVGFGSLILADLNSLIDFGYYSAIGVMISYVYAIVITPLTVSFLPAPKPTMVKRYSGGTLSRLLAWVGEFDQRRATLVVVVCVAAIAVGVVFTLRLDVETQLAKFIPEHTGSRKGLDLLVDKLAGVTTLDMTLACPDGEDGEPTQCFKQVWALDQLDRLAGFMDVDVAQTQKVLSYADLVKEINRVIKDGDQAAFRIPQTEAELYDVIFFLENEPEATEPFMNWDYSKARIAARIDSMSSKQHLELIETIESWAAANVDQRLKFKATGIVVIYATTVQAIVNTQIKSLIVALTVIGILMTINVRSFKIGAMSMLPNALPIFFTLGVMGLFGIDLNAATVMVACIAIGIAVDDTIHFLTRYIEEFQLDQDVPGAMKRAVATTGKGMVATSLVITGGFMLMVLSEFGPNRSFGYLIALAMMAALVADLFLVEALVVLTKAKLRRSVLLGGNNGSPEPPDGADA